MNISKIKQFIKENFSPEIKDENQYYIRCIFCDDKKNHLGINFQLKVYHCFRCNSSGNISKLYNLLLQQKNIPKKHIHSSSSNKKFKFTTNLYSKSRLIEIFNNIKDTQYENHYFKEYLNKKNVQSKYIPDIIQTLRQYNSNFILYNEFLFFLNNKTPIQARILLPNAKPKYITLQKNSYFKIPETTENYFQIYIVESPLSCLAGLVLSKYYEIFQNSVFIATLGKSRTKNILSQLPYNIKKIIIPDKDNLAEIIKNNSNYSLSNTYLLLLDYKNINDLFDVLSLENLSIKAIINLSNRYIFYKTFLEKTKIK